MTGTTNHRPATQHEDVLHARGEDTPAARAEGQRQNRQRITALARAPRRPLDEAGDLPAPDAVNSEPESGSDLLRALIEGEQTA